MVSELSDRDGATSRIPVALKILIAGGFGAGKTTMVGSVSEIRPLQTEEVLTGVEGADDTSGVEGKRTTTVERGAVCAGPNFANSTLLVSV